MTQVDPTAIDTQTAGGMSAATRVGQLRAAGYSWMPLQTLHAYVNSGLSDDDITRIADQTTKAAKQADRQNAIYNQAKKSGLNPQKPQTFGFKQLFDDPVLQKTPSALLSLKQYLAGAIGPWPIGEPNLLHQQQQLQLRGYGRTLPADGKWGQEWQAASHDYTEALYKSQLAGDKGGSVSLKTVMEGLAALQPTNAFNAILGFIKSVPADMRDLMADAVGATAGTMYNIAHDQRLPFFGGPASAGENRAYGAATSAVKNVANAGLGPTLGELGFSDLNTKFTSGGEAKSIQDNGLALLVRDVSTVMLLTSALGAGGRIWNAISGESRVAQAGLGTQLGLQEAQRGPGVVAKLLGTADNGPLYAAGTRLSRAAAGGLIGGGAATLAGGDDTETVLGAVAAGATLGALSPTIISKMTNVFDNIPALGNTGPELGKLFDAEGWYYKTRSLLATPYKYAPVRTAGLALTQGTFLGAEIQGAAAIQEALGGTNQSQAIQGEHFFDAVNDAIKFRLPFIDYDVGLDDLQWFLHGPKTEFIKGTEITKGTETVFKGIPVPGTKLSKTLGGQVNGLLQIYQDRLHEIGVMGIAEKITGRTTAQLVKEYGGLEKVNDFWWNNIADHAAWMAVEDSRARELLGDGLPVEESISDEERAAELSDAWTAIRSDPVKSVEAVKKALAQGRGASTQELISRVRRETAVSRAGLRKYQNAGEYMDAVYHARREIVPYIGQYLEDGQTAGHSILLGASTEPGHTGLADVRKFSRQSAATAANRLEDEWHAMTAQVGAKTLSEDGLVQTVTGVPVDEMNAWNNRVDQLLQFQFGIRAVDIPESGLEKVQLIREHGQKLASDIIVNPFAPPEVHDAVQRLHEMGYKLVNGTGIGNIITNTAVPTDLMAEGLTYQRRIASFLGLSPEMVPNVSINTERGTRIIEEWTKDFIRGANGEKGGVVINSPHVTPNDLWQMLHKHGFVDTDSFPQRLRKAVATASGSLKRASKRTGVPIEELEQELTRTLLPQDVPEKQFVEAVTNADKMAEHFPEIARLLNSNLTPEQEHLNMALYGTSAAPLTDTAGAHQLYASMIRGASKVPTSMLGLQHLEEVFRAVGYIGKEHGLPISYSVANLPNKLVQLRNQFRFDLNPWFSAKVKIKTNIKMMAEGVPPTGLHVREMMEKGGIWQEGSDIVARVYPEAVNPLSDAADYVLRSGDMWGINTPGDDMAWASYHWKQEGLTDPQIRDKIIHTFAYGDDGVLGRSALERSTNFLFFPFSFEKTVVRNLGGYLLDHPAQRVLLTKGLAAYDTFNREHADNPLSTEFLKKHAPLLQEVADLNMFTHGLSLGEPGGINRPVLNMFLPQSWAPTQDNLDKLKRFVPVVKEFNQLLGRLGSQTTILGATMDNLYQDLSGTTATFASGMGSAGPRKSTLTPEAQRDAGFSLQRELFTNYQTILDHNASTRDPGKKIRFEADPKWGRYAGEVISKGALREIIHGYYPAYDPNEAVRAATTNDANFNQYLLSLKGSPLYDDVQQFADYAHTLGNAMNHNRGTTETVVQLTAWLRTKAAAIAGQDSQFLRLYGKKFSRILGPLEKVR